MPNLAVYRPGEIEDLTYNPRQPGKTNLAYGAYENPKTFSAMTSNGDFAGEVGADYSGKIRIIDPASGEALFEGSGNQATGAAFTAVNEIAKSKGRNASWAVQIDDGKGGWATAASDFVDPKEASPLGMFADVVLPIVGMLAFPFAAPAFAAISAMGAAAAGAALGSLTSSIAQGRSPSDAIKRALISGATAGIAHGVSSAVANASINAATSAMGQTAAQSAAKGVLSVAEAMRAGATAAQLTTAGVSSAAVQTAANTLAAAGEIVGVTVTGASAAANAFGGAANLAINTAGNIGGAFTSDTLNGGFFDKKPVTNTTETKPTGDSTVQEVTVVGRNPASGTIFDDVLTGGPLLGEVVVPGKGPTPEQAQIIHKSLALGLTPEEIAIELGVPLAAVTLVQANGAAIEAANLADPAIGGGEIMGAGNVPAFATLKEGMAWIAANPLLAARLGLTAASLLATFGGGSGVDGNGLATGGGTPSALQQSALFNKALPGPSGIFANLTPRDVSKTVTDWNNYGAGPEQSFFNSVPVRASGVVPDPVLAVKPTGTGTTGTGGTTNPNLAVNPKQEGILDLRNLPTSLSNPYAGYATTRTPPPGAVALPENSNARFVVQDPMTADEAAKQARMSAAMASSGLPTSKDGLAVNPTTSTAVKPNLAVKGTDAYSAADLARFDTFSPETAASMRAINAKMAEMEAAKQAAANTPKGPGGTDLGMYNLMTNNFTTNAEREKYNADLDRSTILKDEPRMDLINSPEWFASTFNMTPAQAQAAAAEVGKTPNLAVNPTVPKAATPNLVINPTVNKDATSYLQSYFDAHPELVDKVKPLPPKDNTASAEWMAHEDAIFANAANKNFAVNPTPSVGTPVVQQATRSVDYFPQPIADVAPVTRSTPTPAEPTAPVVQQTTQPTQGFKLPDDVLKQLESYNFQFKNGGTTSHAFAVKGMGDGREDKIDAKLSDGEYVIDAETVALLGNGSSKAGADRLDQFRVNVRKHKGQKLASGKFSANAKSPEAYMAGGRR